MAFASPAQSLSGPSAWHPLALGSIYACPPQTPRPHAHAPAFSTPRSPQSLEPQSYCAGGICLAGKIRGAIDLVHLQISFSSRASMAPKPMAANSTHSPSRAMPSGIRYCASARTATSWASRSRSPSIPEGEHHGDRHQHRRALFGPVSSTADRSRRTSGKTCRLRGG